MMMCVFGCLRTSNGGEAGGQRDTYERERGKEKGNPDYKRMLNMALFIFCIVRKYRVYF